MVYVNDLVFMGYDATRFSLHKKHLFNLFKPKTMATWITFLVSKWLNQGKVF